MAKGQRERDVACSKKSSLVMKLVINLSFAGEDKLLDGAERVNEKSR